MAGVSAVGVVSVGLATVGVVVAVAAIRRAPAERRLGPWSALVGLMSLTATAVLAVVLPPISFHRAVLWGLLGGGAILGLAGGSAVRVRRDPAGVLLSGGAWHLLPAAVALLSLQLVSLASWLDGVVFATAGIVSSTAFAAGAGLLVIARAALSRGRTGPTSWRRGALVWLLAGAAVVALAIGYRVIRGGPATPPTSQPAPVASASPTAPSPSGTASPAEPSTPAPEPTSAAPATPGSRYIGLVFPNGEPPPGISELGGALVADTGHATSWMAGPEGDMFWLLREAGSDASGSITQWEVRDVVVWPPVTEDSAQVVTGAVLCEVDGAPVAGVVAVFPFVDAEWFVDPYVAWWADTASGSFVSLPSSTRCRNEGYGV